VEVESRWAAFWEEYGPYLAFGLALIATLGSLYYSEIAGFVPCTLCWYQRILMYPITVITLVGILRRDRGLPAYVLPLSIIGMGMSSYHRLIELQVIGHSGVCRAGVPCDLLWVNYFGFLTIPGLALTAFVLITAVMAVTAWASHRPVTAG
jgi:disulfide bond formation protein DsbB